MAVCRNLSKNKIYLNHYSMDGLLLIVLTIALMILLHSTIASEMKSNKVSCSDSMTCTKCTIKPMCVWSLKQQVCENKNQFNSSSIIASRIKECPRFSVVQQLRYFESNIQLNYTVKISNVLSGFINYLNNSVFYSGFVEEHDGTLLNPLVNKYNETIISCTYEIDKCFFDPNTATMTYFTFIEFNGVLLRFDNVADHYTTYYEKQECSTDDKYKSCATCAWNYDGYMNHLKLCPSNNTCKVAKNTCMRNNATQKVDADLFYVTNDCAEINVTAVDPLYGPQTGGTIISITVRNHRVFAENRAITVTVAGTVCADPRTSGLETIKCTTSQTGGTPSGPILVEYYSSELTLKIESSHIFNLVVIPNSVDPGPVLDADQRLGAFASGGTTVPVRGVNFIEPYVTSPARLFVKLPNDTVQLSSSYCDPPVNNTYMICRSPKLNIAGVYKNWPIEGQLFNFGLDLMNLTTNRSLIIDGPLTYSVYFNPELKDFEIYDNGSLVIDGLNLKHVQPNDIVVTFLNSSTTGCIVVVDNLERIVCKLTMLRNSSALSKILVKIGDSLSYTVGKKSPPPFDGPYIPPIREHPSDHPFTIISWFYLIIFMSTALVIFSVLACCLRRAKH